ncbi:MAG TPA: helix-turn-helix domain-containing protein [Thermoanaerobaculia bacterium]|nr:helix-turn-helix domain-containing protein [Thermoanaerobaculia bacterium]
MKVLVVDPDPESRDALRRAFSASGGQIRGVASAAEGSRHLAELLPDIVVAAVDLPNSGAERFLSEAAGDRRRAVWALVPTERLDLAVEAMRRGAEDFLWRPVSAGRVSLLLQRFARRRAAEERAEEDRLRLARVESAVALPGRSPRWTEAMASIERLAPETAVLVTGEEGTEKEAAARFLHRLSPRGAGPFVKVGEGVGFRDALSRAAAGTLLVTGVDRIPLAVQWEILSALVSEEQPGLVLAADRDPADAVRRRELAAGILSRLEDRVLHLPPLRERGDDVSRLARHFLEEASATLSFDAEAMDALTAHDWPGNVQELREAVKRAAKLAEGPTIGPTVVRSVLGRPLAARGSRRRRVPVVRIAVGDSLADVERRLIQKTLEFARGNKRKTAELLKLSLKTIYNKIKEYGLEH